jgi:hypothetical protein
VVEGWRDAVPEQTSSSLEDAFDLDVADAYDPDGNPMSFPSDSFIVFSSQIERLDVLEPGPERKQGRSVASDRDRSGGAIKAPIQPAPTDISTRNPERSKPGPEPAVSPERAATDDGEGGLGRVIKLPEFEQVPKDPPAAVLAPIPEPASEQQQIPPIDVTPRVEIPAAPARPAQKAGTAHRSHPLWWVTTVALILVIALVADGFYTFFALGHSLDSAKRDLKRGAHALLAGHYQAAKTEFKNAGSAAGTADGLQGHPSFWVASHLPLLNRDAAALRALGHSSDWTSLAGLGAVQAVIAMGGSSEGLAANIYTHGQVNLNASQKGVPLFLDIESLLTNAYTALRAAPPPFLAPVRDALTVAIEKVAEARDAVHKTRSLVAALPSLFGRDQTRRYLLVFDNPSIARGSGGPIDYYGLLTARSGALHVGPIQPVDLLAPPAAPASAAPGWFRKAYQSDGALTSWEHVGESPTFPAVAPVIERFYEAASGRTVDGVIEMDAVAMGLLSKAVGTLRQPNFDIPVTSRNAVQVLTHDVYVHFGQDQIARDLYVSGLIKEVWTRIARGEATAAELATALGDASKGSHFNMFSGSAADEKALNQVGVGASFSTFQPNVQMAVSNDTTTSRLGYYVHRKVDTVARLTRTGQAYVTTSVRVQNSAPRVPEPILVRQQGTGLLQTDLSLVLPLNTKVQTVSVGGKPHHFKKGPEGINPRLTLPLRIRPGSSTTVVYSYIIPHAFDVSTNGGVFHFTSLPQSTANPDTTTLRVIPPEGYPVVETGSIGGRLSGDTYLATDTTGGLVQVTVKVAPTP